MPEATLKRCEATLFVRNWFIDDEISVSISTSVHACMFRAGEIASPTVLHHADILHMDGGKMTDPAQAIATQRRNIETKTGRTLEDLRDETLASGFVKHGQIRSFAMDTFALGFGDANSLAHFALETKGAFTASEGDDDLAEIYPPKRFHLRPIHDALATAIAPWGDYQLAPKKAYVAFRRNKQFAMLGPKTNERAELGINLKDEVGSDRVVKQKPGGMCQYVVSLTRPEDIDQEVLAVLRRAFDAAG